MKRLLLLVVSVACLAASAASQHVAKLDFSALASPTQAPPFEISCPNPYEPLTWGVSIDYSVDPPQQKAFGCLNPTTGDVLLTSAVTMQVATPATHFNDSFTGGRSAPGRTQENAPYPFYTSPWSLVMSDIAAPSAPTVTNTGSGSTTYTYQVVEISGLSNTEPSISSSINNASSLSGSVFNTISGSCRNNVDLMQVYREAGSSTGLIGTTQCTNLAYSLKDTGQGGGNSLPQAVTSGSVAAHTFFVGSEPTINTGNPAFFNSGQIFFSNSNSDGYASDDTIGMWCGQIGAMGLTFHANEVFIGQSNCRGVDSNPSFGAGNGGIAWFPGPGVGLGNAGVGGTDSIWQWSVTQTNGSNRNTILASNVASGQSFPQDSQIPVQAEYIVPAQAGKISVPIPVTNGTILSCSGTSLIPCTTITGMFVVRVYVWDTASCVTPGTAAVKLTASYNDGFAARSYDIPLQTNTGTTETNLPLGTGINFGSGFAVFWSANSAISIIANTTQCTTGAAAATAVIDIRQLN